jgi:type I restriction enzyme R subunit
VRQIQSIYEILSPDPFLRPFMDNYQAIIRLYGTIRAAYNTSAYIDIELTAKTKELVRKNVKISDLEMPGIIYELNTQQLEKFHQNQTTETVKVLNLSKALFKDVEDKSRKSPFLISIGDRAEKIRQQFENRQIEATEALARLEEITKERIQAETERENLQIDENTYAIYTVIKQAIDNVQVKQAETINAIYNNFLDYRWDARHEVDLQQIVIKPGTRTPPPTPSPQAMKGAKMYLI